MFANGEAGKTGEFWIVNVLERFFCVFVVSLIIFNGVLNHILDEVFAEGLCLAAGFLFILFKVQFSTRFPLQLFLLIFFMLSNVTLVVCQGEFIKLLFLYPYLFFLLVLILPLGDVDGRVWLCLGRTFIYFSCVSALYAVAQRVGFETFLPLENETRATGLSRSSLNLTGCMFAALVTCSVLVREGWRKNLATFVIFLGLVAAGGRGGIFAGLLLLMLARYKYGSRTQMIKFLSFLLVMVICLLVLDVYNDELIRLLSVFNFTSEQSNLDRLGSYMLFFDKFQLWGSGVGSTSSAAGRFHETVGFESSVLNMVYEIGVGFSVLFLVALLNWFFRLSSDLRHRLSLPAISLVPILLGQQLYGIPSAFVALMICFSLIISLRSSIRL